MCGEDVRPKPDAAAGIAPNRFPIVGIVASAGGIDAMKELFSAMPADSGLAFVVIQHLEPHSTSRMAEILGRSTRMAVRPAEDGMTVEPNTVYTNPPGRPMSLEDGKLVLQATTEGAHVERAIDHFLVSLAAERRTMAIGIILSGSNGLDGPAGVRAVRQAGGTCLAQDPATAQFAAMPEAAIATGLVDRVLRPADMPQTLMAFARHLAHPTKTAASGAESNRVLDEIVDLLRTRSDSDYRHYKRATLTRRVERRMGLRHMADRSAYLRLLQSDAAELQQLTRDMLIGVSSFFRDDEVFRTLERDVLPLILRDKADDSPLRAWVAGCASGEEAYSIAMLLLEARWAAGKSCPVQVFATDVDEQALLKARAGVYPESIVRDVPAARLQAFFTRRNGSFVVTEKLREVVVFSRHNLLSDPPFSKLDLISCRNVLIYIDASAQRKVLSVFSFGLNTGGFLLLGRSEGVAGLEDLLVPFAGKDRLYRLAARKRRVELPLYRTSVPAAPVGGERPTGEPSALTQANVDVLLRHFDACLVLTEADGRILYFHGRTLKYLCHAEGPATLNIFDMIGGTLSAMLRKAVEQASSQDEPVHLQGVPLPQAGALLVNVSVMRVPRRGGGTLLGIIFEDSQHSVPAAVELGKHANEPLVVRLEEEIRLLRTELRTEADGHEAATQELRAASEEVMSMNEELQSANEELEASKEELQSVNEELTTVNAQLNDNVGELRKANDDLANLLMATEIAILFLDTKLRIRRFTPRMTVLMNVIESDKGRPISHITHHFPALDVAAEAESVLRNLAPVDREAQDQDGKWFTVRITPYRTVDGAIEGVVVTFIDVTRLKLSETRLRYEKAYAEKIIETVRHPLLVLGENLCVLSANRAFYDTFHTEPGNTTGVMVYELGNGQWDIPRLRDLLQDVIPHQSSFRDYRVEHAFERIGPKVMLLSGRRVEPASGIAERILLSIEDVTDREQAEKRVREGADNLARANEGLKQFAYIVSHDLQEPLRMITGFIDLLGASLADHLDDKTTEYFGFVSEGARQMQGMIRDLLDLSRIGRADSHRQATPLDAPLQQALANLRTTIDQSGAVITHDALPTVIADDSQLARLFQNLIGNALKFRRGDPPAIHISAASVEKGWLISVRDNGIGIDMRYAERVFEPFQRLHTRDQFEGSGIGLAICKTIVERHGGRIWLESVPGKGTIFYFTLPGNASA